MQKTILSIAAVALCSASLFAQIPNNGFENWTSMGTYNNPNGWDQLNGMTSGMSVYTCSKGTPGNIGTAYLKLTSKTVTGMGVVPGVAVSGVLNSTTMQPKSGFSYSQRPTALTGAWQHMIYGSSQGFITVTLTRWNAGTQSRVPVGSGSVTLSGMAMSWANFSIPISYSDANNPDSCIIVLSASGTTPTNNDYLWVDNLGFTVSTAGINTIDNYVSNITTYPNPSSDNVIVELNAQKPSHINLQLIDVTGKIINEVNAGLVQGNYKHTINTTDITKGIYFLKVVANDAVEVKKIIIQ